MSISIRTPLPGVARNRSSTDWVFWDARVDVIADYDGERVAVQCKTENPGRAKFVEQARVEVPRVPIVRPSEGGQSRGRTMNHSTNSAHRSSSSNRNVHRFQKKSSFV
jgi:hypothetical protein